MYHALPFQPSAERREVVSKIMREMASKESLFTDFQKPCSEACMECEECNACLASTLRFLSRPDARIWEVWKLSSTETRDSSADVDEDVKLEEEEAQLVGVLYLSNIVEGCDATAHYLFFDGDLAGKASLMREMLKMVFTDTEEWVAPNRLTVEVPEFAFALARHAMKLGFGGSFDYEGTAVEGVKEDAVLWRGKWWDLLVMGLTKEDVLEEDTVVPAEDTE